MHRLRQRPNCFCGGSLRSFRHGFYSGQHMGRSAAEAQRSGKSGKSIATLPT